MAEGTLQITISNQIILATSISIAGAGGLNSIDIIGGTLQLTETVLPSNTTDKTVTWSVITGSSYASVNSSGLVTALDYGTAEIRTTTNDGSGISSSFIVSISKEIIYISSIIITGTGGVDYILELEGTLQMIATILPIEADDQTFTWSVINDSGTATIDSDGLLTAISPGTVIVIAIANDSKGSLGQLDITIYNETTGKLAPDGWHIPTNDEWTILQTEIGGFFSGYKLKEIGFTNWSPPNTSATNESNFTVLGVGFRHYSTGIFQYIKELGWMWTADEEDTLLANIAQLWYDSANFQIGLDLDKRYGLPVRCVKDDDVLGTGTLEDIDGNIYTTIKIGNQVWMTENLKVTHFTDGTPIPIIEDNTNWVGLTTAAMCYYNNISP
jgi:uncharacterized protein (TIGR02145 family)